MTGSDDAATRGLSRRKAINHTASAATALMLFNGTTKGSATVPTALTDLSAIEAVAAMRRGDVTAEAYTNALLARAAQCKALNAFITLEPDRVLGNLCTSSSG
jgi:indoleacetamide hydrolase